MKHFIACIILMAGMLIASIAGVEALPSEAADQTTVRMENCQTATVTQESGVVRLEPADNKVGDFLAAHWGILSLSLLSFLEVITRLTPSEKDNTVLKVLSNILNAIIPNLRKGGGRLQE